MLKNPFKYTNSIECLIDFFITTRKFKFVCLWYKFSEICIPPIPPFRTEHNRFFLTAQLFLRTIAVRQSVCKSFRQNSEKTLDIRVFLADLDTYFTETCFTTKGRLYTLKNF